jgi:hypothetical protein
VSHYSFAGITTEIKKYYGDSIVCVMYAPCKSFVKIEICEIFVRFVAITYIEKQYNVLSYRIK